MAEESSKVALGAARASIEQKVSRLERLVRAELEKEDDVRDKRRLSRTLADALEACEGSGDMVLKGRALVAIWPLLVEPPILELTRAEYIDKANQKRKAYNKCRKKAKGNPKALAVCWIYYHLCGYKG